MPKETRVKGIDPNHIQASDIALIIDTLSYNNQGELRAGLRTATLKERCGLAVNKLRGQIWMDTTRLQLPALEIYTPHSAITANVAFDFRSFTEGKAVTAMPICALPLGATTWQHWRAAIWTMPICKPCRANR